MFCSSRPLKAKKAPRRRIRYCIDLEDSPYTEFDVGFRPEKILTPPDSDSAKIRPIMPAHLVARMVARRKKNLEIPEATDSPSRRVHFSDNNVIRFFNVEDPILKDENNEKPECEKIERLAKKFALSNYSFVEQINVTSLHQTTEMDSGAHSTTDCTPMSTSVPKKQKKKSTPFLSDSEVIDNMLHRILTKSPNTADPSGNKNVNDCRPGLSSFLVPVTTFRQSIMENSPDERIRDAWTPMWRKSHQQNLRLLEQADLSSIDNE